MPFPEQLLEQARHLANREPKRPKQASLRRAVSTAYYALFHLLIAETVKNWKVAEQRNTLARTFNHGSMKEASNAQIISLRPSRAAYLIHQQLYGIAETFVLSQQSRHAADYDNSKQWTKTEVLAQIQAVESAFQAWHAVRNESVSQAYLLSLFCRQR